MCKHTLRVAMCLLVISLVTFASMPAYAENDLPALKGFREQGFVKSDQQILPAYVRGLNFLLELKDEILGGEDEKTIHEVQPGDSVFTISREYEVDPAAIVVANNLSNPNLILPGQELLIPPPGQILHQVVSGDTLYSLGDYYSVNWKDIAASNEISVEAELKQGQLLTIPGGTIPASIWNRGVLSRGGDGQISFIWPLKGRITSYFGPRWGKFHYGIDIGQPCGTPIRAAASGVVKVACWQGSYGYVVFVEHENGWETRYGHASRLLVKQGQWVNQGEKIALVGETGNATGPHLHFEIRYQGTPRNPLNYLP